MRSFGTLSLALLSLAACTDPGPCPAGTVRTGSTCRVNAAGSDSSAGAGSGDGGAPSPCTAACDRVSASWCDATTRLCARCQTDEHCAGLEATPVCLTDVGCVQCNVDADCSDGKPLCVDHTCSPCERDWTCPRRESGIGICDDDGACVQCTSVDDRDEP